MWLAFRNLQSKKLSGKPYSSDCVLLTQINREEVGSLCNWYNFEYHYETLILKPSIRLNKFISLYYYTCSIPNPEYVLPNNDDDATVYLALDSTLILSNSDSTTSDTSDYSLHDSDDAHDMKNILENELDNNKSENEICDKKISIGTWVLVTYHSKKMMKRSAYEEADHVRRIKRIDHDLDCDNNGFTNLIIGCNNIDTMEFRSDCSAPDFITTYSCHGRWEENGTNFLITTPLSRASYGARRFCFIYKEQQGSGLVMFSTSTDSCNRLVKPGITGELIFNITTIGK
ncbi:hypothetical protein NQ314_017511 [Rhamnusium bicolor]|uniref:Uncharacterized protein n=1 Tax=Rhamnusium bicolor TaxID=1586634 RepID=A0AAV8WT72_9CUCU|nr:hypothetical protein NQ314_017511 [Rhamnusium bicolor]